MTFNKTIALCIAGVLAAAGTPGFSGKLNMGTVATDGYSGPLPPEGHQGRRWSHPNGCDYSLAGRPGERVWYLIVNTRGNNDCVRYFVEQSLPNDISVTRNVYKYN